MDPSSREALICLKLAGKVFLLRKCCGHIVHVKQIITRSRDGNLRGKLQVVSSYISQYVMVMEIFGEWKYHISNICI